VNLLIKDRLFDNRALAKLIMVYHIYTAAYSNEVTTLAFDPDESKLTLISSITVGHKPSWVSSYPGDGSLVYAVLEQDDGKILAITYDAEGKGKVVAEVSSGGAGPCSLHATKDTLYVANYSSSTVSHIKISHDAPYFLSSPTTIQLQGTGPHERQERSHPHQAFLHDDQGEFLVPDLGADILRRFKVSRDGQLSYSGHIQYPLGGGPRHVAIYDGYLYTLLELTSVLVKHKLPSSPGLPKLIKSTPTMSNPPPQPTDMLAAEILIPTPTSSFPTPYLYCSNRNDPSPEGDIIAIFAISGETLELVTEVRTGLNHVRGMLFGGPDDKWLVAGGLNGGGVKVFERIEGGKNLRFVAGNTEVLATTGFLWK